MLLLAAYVLLDYLLWRGWRRTIPRVDGVRKPAPPLYCQAIRWRVFYP